METKTITCFWTFTLLFCCDASYWQYSIKVNLAVVRQLHVREGLASLDKLMGKVTASDEGDKSTTSLSHQRKLVTPLMLRKIKSTREKGELTQNKIMLWATFLLCFFGFMRSGKIFVRRGLGRKNHTSRVPGHCNWWLKQSKKNTSVLKQSKTDVFSQGTRVHISCTNDICGR